MTRMTRHDFAHLLARARTAILATEPTDNTICDDLGAAARLMESQPFPWPLDLHVAFVDHRQGGNLHAALSREALVAEISAFCREWWSEIRDARDPATLTDEDVCAAYFEAHEDEYLWTDRISIDPSESSITAPRVGHHLTISTSHIRPSTGDILDSWAAMAPDSRPLGVAEAGYGWFARTADIDGAERDMIPDDLRAAISFARAQGCHWLLLDRDADEIADLETFDW